MSRATILLAFLAACAPSYESRAFDWPWVPQLPPPPPERAMRIAPDFSFRDEEKGKEYFIRVYSDREFEEELVTVVDRNDPAAGERLATLDEYDFAMKSFESLWEKKRLEERLRYHRELREKEVRRDATQIDSLLRLTKDVLRSLESQKFEIDAEIRARRAVGTDADAQHMAFLNRRSDELQFDLLVRTAQKEILEYKRWLRERRQGAVAGTP